MSYPRERLAEALRVIREDKERRYAEEVKKIAETQYREGFHLRRSTAVHGHHISLWRDSENSDDDEYDPKGMKKQNNKRKKRLNTGTPSKKQKTENLVVATTDENEDVAIDDTTHAFVTLKLQTEKAKAILAKQNASRTPYHRQRPGSDNVTSPWRESSGGLHRANRSMPEHRQDFEVAQYIRKLAELDLETETFERRTLRNGKVRKGIPQKRKRDNIDSEANIVKHQKMTDYEPPSDPVTPPKQSKPGITQLPHNLITPPKSSSQGESIDDAISITSSSNDEVPNPSPPTPLTPFSNFFSPPAQTPSKTTTLRTSFAHPINFHSPPGLPCTFHTDYRHPILGHGPVTGQYLILQHQPSQLIELEGGHRTRQDNNFPQDTMCTACASTYLRIITCPLHTFTALPYNPALSDGGRRYVQDMFPPFPPGHPNRTTKPIAPTCQLCPQPAGWKCCSMQSTSHLHPQTHIHTHTHINTNPQTPPSPNTHGCGLQLCSACHTLLCLYNSDLQAHRAEIIREVRMRRLGARADIEFSFRDGLVWKAYFVDNVDG